MPQNLHSLILTGDAATARELEHVIRTGIPELGHKVTVQPGWESGQISAWVDLLFIDIATGLDDGGIQATLAAFKDTTCVVLADCTAERRKQLLRTGVDEVMSLEELKSPLGHHLLEKLLAVRQLDEAQQRAAQSEARFKGVIEYAHEIILLLDGDGMVVYASPAYGRQSGFEEWEILGQDIFSFVHPDDGARVRQGFVEVCAASAHKPQALEYRLGTKGEGWRQYEAVATNLLATDTVNAVVMNLRDVTAQRQAEEQLENYRQHLETLVERRTRELVEVQARANTVINASPDALLAIDHGGNILFISQHYRAAYPQSAPLLVPGQRIPVALASVAREMGLIEGGARYEDLRNWWMKPEGSKEMLMDNGTWLRLTAKPMEDGRGIVVATTNISDLKSQQALLSEQSAELASALATEREIVEQQKTFVSMVSHEFRTPLTIIDGNAQIIESRAETLDAPTLKRRSTTIRGAVDRLVRLIDAILSSHMMDMGRMQVTPAPCRIGDIIDAAAREQGELSGSHAVVTDMRDLPAQAMMDEQIVRQLLVNLISNAVKYSPGKDRVDVRAWEERGQIVVSVQDYGVGIPADELPRIASKYFRASTSSGIPGTGLGLSLVRRFVEMHNGTFDITSTEGEGTTVTVRLPVVAPAID